MHIQVHIQRQKRGYLGIRGDRKNTPKSNNIRPSFERFSSGIMYHTFSNRHYIILSCIIATYRVFMGTKKGHKAPNINDPKQGLNQLHSNALEYKPILKPELKQIKRVV